MWYHLVGRVQEGSSRLTDHRVAGHVWRSLRQAFPEVAAAVLMPDHYHVLAPGMSAGELRARQAKAIGGLTRSKQLKLRPPLWEPVPEPRPIGDLHKLATTVRYLALNPCRSHYVGDPLRWMWSTLLDVLGFIAAPWVDAAGLARALDRKREGFEAWFRRYVFNDHAVDGQGPLHRPVDPTIYRTAGRLERAILAAAIATRALPVAIRRRGATRKLFVQLAWEVGLTHPGLIARRCGITTETVRQIRSGRDLELLTPGLRCFAEERVISMEPRFPKIRFSLDDPRDRRVLQACAGGDPWGDFELGPAHRAESAGVLGLSGGGVLKG